MRDMKGGGSKAGVKQAATRNPNKHSNLNDTPEGPRAHCMGYSGDSGYEGDTSVKHRGSTFNFK